MRPLFIAIAIVVLSLGAGATYAQTPPGTPPANPTSLTTLRLPPSATPPVGISAHRQSPPQSQQKERDNAAADCVRMWDSGTHMTKQEWARTCNRVQSRLDNLKVDGLMPQMNTRVR